MDDEKYKGYLTDFISLLKKQAKKAKKDADNPKEGFEDYSQGELMAYYLFSDFPFEASSFRPKYG
jgi:hypothetical protein